MNVPVQLSDRGTEASAPERQTLLALDSVDAKSIAKKKEQEKPKGFTVWVGGFPDNCVDDHKLFHREMERVGALARRTLQTPRALPDTAAPLSPRRRVRVGVQAVRAAVRMGALRGAGPEDPGKVLSVTVREVGAVQELENGALGIQNL